MDSVVCTAWIEVTARHIGKCVNKRDETKPDSELRADRSNGALCAELHKGHEEKGTDQLGDPSARSLFQGTLWFVRCVWSVLDWAVTTEGRVHDPKLILK